MTQYIDKAAIVAEIDNILNYAEEHWDTDYVKGAWWFADKLQNAINTLGVKEVDLKKEIYSEWDKCNPVDEGMGCEFATIAVEQFYYITKYFFELGFKAQKEK